MNQRLFILVLLIVSGVFSACSSINLGSSPIFNSSAPTDEEARQVIMRELAARNVVIKDKRRCELSANTQAMGITERWVITWDGQIRSNQRTDTQVTIQLRNGTWVWAYAMAYCG